MIITDFNSYNYAIFTISICKRPIFHTNFFTLIAKVLVFRYLKCKTTIVYSCLWIFRTNSSEININIW